MPALEAGDRADAVAYERHRFRRLLASLDDRRRLLLFLLDIGLDRSAVEAESNCVVLASAIN